jgi:hypothetical protein
MTILDYDYITMNCKGVLYDKSNSGLKHFSFILPEYKELLDKYHALVESNGNQFEDCKATVRIETERDLLKVLYIFPCRFCC